MAQYFLQVSSGSSSSVTDGLHHELAAELISQEQGSVGREGAYHGGSQARVQSGEAWGTGETHTGHSPQRSQAPSLGQLVTRCIQTLRHSQACSGAFRAYQIFSCEHTQGSFFVVFCSGFMPIRGVQKLLLVCLKRQAMLCTVKSEIIHTSGKF